MAVFRVEKNRNYTVMSNVHLDDRRLSLRAIGLLSRMLRQPDDWDYTVEGLAAQCKEGRDAIRKVIQELIAAGYIVRHRTHREDGAFDGIEYIIYERPQQPEAGEPPDESEAPLAENPTVAESLAAEPSAENPTLVKPTLVNPTLEKPTSENPTQPSTIEEPSTNIPPYNPPKGGRRKRKRREPRDAPEWKPERFAGMWAFYPREGRQNKQDAMDAWDDLRPDDGLIDQIARALIKLLATEKWQRGIGIPYVATFLRNQRWKDADELPDIPERADGPEPPDPVLPFAPGEGFWMGGGPDG